MIYNIMNILLYDNTQMSVKNGHFYCASGTGNFAQELVELGNCVTMYGQQVEDSASTSSFDILSGGINVAGMKRYRSKILSYLLLYLHSVKYIIKADFVYFFYPTSYRYLPFLCMLLGKKYGLYVRGDKDVDNSLSRFLYRHAYVVFTVAKLFTDMVNASSSKNNGFTIRPMISYTDKDIVTNRIYKKKENYNILFLCRLQKEKGLEDLLAAIRQLNNNNVRNFCLTVVGGGPYLETAKNKIVEFGIEDFVLLVGAVNDEEEKKEYFLNADLYILPTYYNEGFPRTLYEAMIFGTPIITTFVSGIPSLMEDGYNCIRIEEHSVESIIDALTFSMENYTYLGELAKHATNTVLQVLDSYRPSHAQDVNNAISSLKRGKK